MTNGEGGHVTAVDTVRSMKCWDESRLRCPCLEASGLLRVPPGGPGILMSLHCPTVLEKFMLTGTHRKVTQAPVPAQPDVLPQAQGSPGLHRFRSPLETRGKFQTRHPDYCRSLGNTMKDPM